jgi:hypothetical protein
MAGIADPFGLPGDDNCVETQILTAAEIFDAIANGRNRDRSCTVSPQ